MYPPSSTTIKKGKKIKPYKFCDRIINISELTNEKGQHLWIFIFIISVRGLDTEFVWRK
jgi:hypothetical protein